MPHMPQIHPFWVIWAIVALVFALRACVPSDPTDVEHEAYDLEYTQMTHDFSSHSGFKVWRFIDHEQRVVCYTVTSGAVSCVPMAGVR